MKNKITLTILACALLIGCGGSNGSTGTDSALSADTRAVSGSVANDAKAVVLDLAPGASPGCRADTVIATDTTGATTVADVGDDCTFDLNLTLGEAYAISFVKDDAFVAALIFDRGVNGIKSSFFVVGHGRGKINLGKIVFTGDQAVPTVEPIDQCDFDNDGINDRNDSDDDNNGTLDDNEEDCHMNGYLDDKFDTSFSCHGRHHGKDEGGNGLDDGSDGSDTSDDSGKDSSDDAGETNDSGNDSPSDLNDSVQ